MDAAEAGRVLAERHRGAPADAAPEGSLVNYAESPRAGDWTLRSALVRLAQPEPERVAAVLELVRRLDAVLHHVARPLEKQTVVCDRAISVDGLGDPVDPYPDTRTADLARLAASVGDDGVAVIDAYAGEVELTPEEQGALPLLGVALRFDALAEALVAWAHTAPKPPPVDLVDATCAEVLAELDALGVPREEGPPPGRGRGRRS